MPQQKLAVTRYTANEVCNLIRQQKELLAAEGVTLEFEDAAIREMARVATLVNRTVESSCALNEYSSSSALARYITCSFEQAERLGAYVGEACSVVLSQPFILYDLVYPTCPTSGFGSTMQWHSTARTAAVCDSTQ
eukprot:7047-Heterococcus_DN1.PRE.2